MKNLRLLALLILTATAFLDARVGNFNTDGSIDAVADAANADVSKVLTNSKFTTSVYDATNNILYCADNTAHTDAKHNLIRVAFVAGKPVITALGGITDAITPTPATPLSGVAISKLGLTDSGDLIVMANPVASTQNIFVVKNPASATPIVYAATNTGLTTGTSLLTDGAAVASCAINFSCAGQTSDGKDRIVVVIPQAGRTVLDSQAGDNGLGRLKTLFFDRAAGTFTSTTAIKVGGAALKISPPTNLLLPAPNTNIADTDCITDNSLLGDLSITNFSSMHWDKDKGFLLLGASRNNSSGNDQVQFFLRAHFDVATTSGVLNAIGLVQTVGDATNTSALGMETQNYWRSGDVKTITCQASGHKYMISHIDYHTVIANRYPNQARCVYAFPLVDDSATAASIGRAADVTAPNPHQTVASDHTKVYTFRSANKLPANASQDIRALVGGAPLPAGVSGSIKKIEVVRDTVFALVTPVANNVDIYAGIWSSSPIYDVNGHIKAWTAWKRVVLSNAVSGTYNVTTTATVDVQSQNRYAIHDFHINKTTGKIYALLGDVAGTVINGVAVMSWGDNTSVSIDPHSLTKLSDQLSTTFGSNGVWTVAHFPAARTAGVGFTGLTIFGQRSKVALAITGALFDPNTGNGQIKTASHSLESAQTGTQFVRERRAYEAYGIAGLEFDPASATLGNRFLAFDDAMVGDVLCATVSKAFAADSTNTDFPNKHGFVFVGGSKGLAVLSSSTGNGFGGHYTNAQLENLTNTFNGFTWKRIPGIDAPVHDVVATEDFVYAMTSKAVYRIRLQGTNRADVAEGTFPATAPNAAPTMFVDNMVVESVDATINLRTGATGANSTAGRYNNNVVVVQKVFDVDSDEYFVNMILAGSHGPSIFVASVNANGSSIRPIFNGDAANPSAGYNAANHKVDLASYHIRKMHFVTPNIYNMGGTLGATLDSGAAAGAVLTSYIGNLYVLTGSILGEKSKIYNFVVNASVSDSSVYSGDLSTNAVMKPARVSVDGTTNAGIDWIVRATPGTNTSAPQPVAGFNGVDTNLLANGFNLDGIPYLFASSSFAFNDHLNYMSASALSPVKHDAGLGTGQAVYGMVTLESGVKVIYGSFGIRFID